jgi:predicted nucleotidyltransferase
VESWPEFKPTRLLRRLTAKGVDFVLVGGFAAVAHGATRLTNDIDICFAPDPANLSALGEVLDEVDARLRGVSEEVPFMPDAATLRRVDHLTLDTADGPLDLLRLPPGAPRYDTLRRRAERIDIGGTVVLVASLDDLISMKRAAKRPVDLLDVESLEAIKRLRKR